VSEPIASARLGSRELFPNLKATAYLSHAAISPPSRSVEAAVLRALTDYAERGVVAYMAWAEQRAVLRERLAELIGAPPGAIALTSGTTRGISDLALCIPWRPGDRVLLFEGEFPANVTPWQQAAVSLGAVPRFMALPDSRGATDLAGFLERLEGELRQGVRLVAVSAVQFQTGLRMPLAEMARLCHAHGAELCVDAIQACGVVPVDVVREDIDYLVCGAHKWLLGVEGAAFVYVRPELRSALVPRVAGWLSHDDGELFLFHGRGLLRYDRPIKSSVTFLEGGSANVMGAAALGAAVDMIQSIGVPAIFEHVGRYLDELESGLVARGFASLRSEVAACRSGILSVDVPPGVEAVELFARLRAQGIAVSLPDGFLRFAPHFPNSAAEIPVVLEAIDRIISG
jgi:selenocysteine lyase/cysteine desulfurase